MDGWNGCLVIKPNINWSGEHWYGNCMCRKHVIVEWILQHYPLFCYCLPKVTSLRTNSVVAICSLRWNLEICWCHVMWDKCWTPLVKKNREKVWGDIRLIHNNICTLFILKSYIHMLFKGGHIYCTWFVSIVHRLPHCYTLSRTFSPSWSSRGSPD